MHGMVRAEIRRTTSTKYVFKEQAAVLHMGVKDSYG